MTSEQAQVDMLRLRSLSG